MKLIYRLFIGKNVQIVLIPEIFPKILINANTHIENNSKGISTDKLTKIHAVKNLIMFLNFQKNLNLLKLYKSQRNTFNRFYSPGSIKYLRLIIMEVEYYSVLFETLIQHFLKKCLKTVAYSVLFEPN